MDYDFDIVILIRIKNLLDRFTLESKSYTVAEILETVRGEIRLDRISELPKSNARSVEFRKTGNRLYSERDFKQAIAYYNKSICYAEVDTEQLGIGYGNRSAVLFERGEYELALYSIDLAKKHKYPERLMPKLVTREKHCKQLIADNQSNRSAPVLRMGINVETNPTIPFLAKGIAMNRDTKYGRGLVSEKDFNPGDIICDEKIELCGIDPTLVYTNCSQCNAGLSDILIPCPTCPMAMFCSEECLKLNWELYHRFECDVASKLFIASTVARIIHPRLFFYGLSQFGDDLQAMMDFCKSKIPAESINPLEIDYTNLNRLDVFKMYHNIKPDLKLRMTNVNKCVASIFYLAFMEHPLVRSVISSEAKRHFFLSSLVRYNDVITSSSKSVESPGGDIMTMMSPIVYIFNHSCDPNAAVVYPYGRVKVVLLRPVLKGEQIFISYAPVWWNPGLTLTDLTFKCQCVVCDRESVAGREWNAMKNRPFPEHATKNLLTMAAVYNSDDTNVATKLIALQQFFKRFPNLHPHEILGAWLDSYCKLLSDCTYEEDAVLLRAKFQAEFVGQ